ncbi:MAG: cytochrome c [Acidimicrobiia bacterium]|nr:cytochrome c [Acidimicrobiia bacterium]
MRKAIALLVMIVATGCSTNLADDASGPEIYSALCSRCHSSDLSGGIGPSLGAGSDLAEQPDSYVTQTISAGLGRMPAFRFNLSEPQIERVVEYLRAQQAAG